MTDATHINDHRQKLANYYRLHSGIYDATRWSFLFGRKKVLKELPDLPLRPRVLEIGCGTGKNIEYLKYLYPDARIVGVDLSPDMLQKADARVAETDQVTLINRQYGNDELSLEPFNLVLLSYTLTMTGSQMESVLRQIYNDIRPAGHIAVVDFHVTSFNWFRYWMKVNHVDIGGHLLPLLNKYFQPVSVKTSKVYFGLWSYLRFLGRRL